MTENNWLETMPVIKTVDLSYLTGGLSNEFAFKTFMGRLTQNSFPTYFPNLPDFKEAEICGIFITHSYKDDLLTLPDKMLDSDTYYADADVLRGVVEEIIIAYTEERRRLGLPEKVVIGENWSKSFYTRLCGDENSSIQTSYNWNDSVNKYPTYNHPKPEYYPPKRGLNRQGYTVARGKLLPKPRCE